MHPPSGPAWLVWLETSGVAVAMRQWTWLYPAVEIAHIVGFVTLVGAALMFDARLLGRSRPLAVSALERHLLPWARWSLLLVVPTGALMFKSEFDLRQAGTWDESKQTVTDTICPYCGVGCTLRLHVQDNQIVKTMSPPDHDVTSGNLCIKGRFGTQFVQLVEKKSFNRDRRPR